MLAFLTVVVLGGRALTSRTGRGWIRTVAGDLLGAAVASVLWAVLTVVTEVDSSYD